MRPWALVLLLGALRSGEAPAPARNVLLLLGECGPAEPRSRPGTPCPGLGAVGSARLGGRDGPGLRCIPSDAPGVISVPLPGQGQPRG